MVRAATRGTRTLPKRVKTVSYQTQIKVVMKSKKVLSNLVNSPFQFLKHSWAERILRPYYLTKGGIQMDRIPDLPNEEWRPIEGYGGKYLVSSLGRVKSLKHANARLLTPFMNNKGYDRVCLCRFGEAHHFLVSRLVA